MSEQANTPTDTTGEVVTAYALLGGEARVRALVDHFYDFMELDEDLAELRALHGPSLDNARDKLFWFLCGWLGGPDYFVERFGHPRLRMRHMPFAINTQGRDQWLICMARALDALGGVDDALMVRLMQAFAQTADWMRNQPG